MVNSARGDFILKCYRQDTPDAMARYLREFSFLSWANRASIREVPMMLANSHRLRWIAMEKLPGTSPNSIGDDHILQAAGFIQRVTDVNLSAFRRSIRARHELRGQTTLLSQLRQRTQSIVKSFPQGFRLGDILPSAPSIFSGYPEGFLENDVHVLQSFIRQVKNSWTSNTILSPSDFGFHNSVETREKDFMVLKFIDFEYAGVDSPLKLMMDFALQPDNLLSERHIGLFFGALDSRFPLSLSSVPQAVWRVFVFKWVLIIVKAELRDTGVFHPSEITGFPNLERYWDRFGGSF